MTTPGIELQWQINRDGFRRAHLPGLTLRVSNGRRGGWGPVTWEVFTERGQIASGEVFQGTRYQALTREAMYQAERAAACDDCGQVSGHDLKVEH